MSEKKYSEKHEWIMLDGESATVGISKHATEMLGDIVFVELPEKGKSLNNEEKAAVVESTRLRAMFTRQYLEKLWKQINQLLMTHQM